MLKILTDFTIEDVPEEVEAEIVEVLNNNSNILDSYLLGCLRLINESLVELKKENCILPLSLCEYILTFKFLARTILTIIESNKASIKITTSIIESIIINCKSILNAIEEIGKLQGKQLENLTPEELLTILTN